MANNFVGDSRFVANWRYHQCSSLFSPGHNAREFAGFSQDPAPERIGNGR
jgi:hypothetical protein